MEKRKKLFLFTDVFDYKRGKRLIREKQEIGDIPFVSSTKENNGIDNFISPPEDMIIYRNCLTFSNSGSVGILYYHNYDFVASDHVTVIWIKDKSIQLNGNIALYLKPIFECMNYKYNFGREIKNTRLENEFLLLPVKQNDAPDWEYMSEYVKKLRTSIEFRPIEHKKKYEKIGLDISKWKHFTIGELFKDFQRGKCHNAGQLVDGNDVFYVGAKKTNMGIIKSVAYDSDLLSQGKCMIFICNGDGSVGYSNYFELEEFIGCADIIIAYNDNLNRYTGIFISSVLDLERPKYSFGRKYGSYVKSTRILLPVSKSGEPDWKFMEEYIKESLFGERVG